MSKRTSGRANSRRQSKHQGKHSKHFSSHKVKHKRVKVRALQLNVRELRQNDRQDMSADKSINIKSSPRGSQHVRQTVHMTVSTQGEGTQTEQASSLLRAASSKVTSDPHVPHIIAIDRPVTWIVLAGFMGAGKSRIGWELSRRLGLNFIDTDKVIERVSCLPVADIFEHYGERVFRNYETEVVRRCLRLDYVVVSTGGGTVVRDINRNMLKSRGPVVLLSASPETTYQRTRRHRRPLLECDDPVQRIRDLMAARKAAYEDVASIRVSTDGRPSEEVVEEIVTKLWRWQEQDQ
ncbi:MAG: shikimate kinase [Deinococcota bacterium]